MHYWEGRGLGGIALAAIACALFANHAYAELNPAQKALEEQGRYWEDRHQPARAVVAWQKLLVSDPGNAEALLHLGVIAARGGHMKEAQHYAARLKAAHPNGPEIAVLENAIRVGKIDPHLIAEARRLAQAGKYEAAIADYRRALNGAPPPPDLAQEYYETLAGTKSGWAAARAGLQRMAAALPNDLSLQYGYARVLTYHQETRRQGIAMLSSLAGDPSIGRQATRAWHDALMWLGAAEKDIPLYKNYLASHPNDKAVAKKLAALENPANPARYADKAHQEALAALNAGHLKEAEQRYEALLKANPKDVDALGGLGVVRERQGKLRDARKLLSQAVALVPKGNTKWQQALSSVIYLEAVAEGRAALRHKHWKVAEARAREALAHPYDHDVNAELVLADAYLNTKRYKQAERIFRHVLHAQPRNREAAAGLARILASTGRTREARHYAARVPTNMVDVARVEASRLAQQARIMLNEGNARGALAAYRAAIARDPSNPWFKLDYARLLTRVGDRNAADRVIAAMIHVPHPSGQVLAAAAIWYGEHGEFQRAAALAARVPPGTQVADFAVMRHQWSAEREAHRAVILAREGRLGEAHRILHGIVVTSQGNIGVVGVAADAYVDIGDPQDAVAVMRNALGPTPDLDAQIQYAGVLLRVGALNELTQVMHTIDEQAGNMRPAQQARVADLHRGLAIKLADQARQQGDYAGAYQRLAPELAISRDATVLAALARIYDSAGRHQDALEVYNRILRSNPSNMDARREIIGAAITVGDYRRAQMLLNQGLAKAPNDPRLHLLAAELARAEGDDDRALAELGRAQAELARRNGQLWMVPGGFGPAYGYREAGYGNPFVSPAQYAPPPTAPAPAYPVTYSAYQTEPTYGANPAYPVPQLAGPISVTPATPEDQQLERQVANQIEQIRDPMRPYVQGGVYFRNIDGEPGMSQFSLVSLPISGGVRMGPGRLTLQVEPTSVDSGSLDSGTPNTFRRFGTNATLGAGTLVSPDYEGSAQGTAVKVGYKTNNLAAELGTTPLGFPVENVIGHLVWAIPLDNQTSLKLTGLRDPVMDSLLSFAGTKDPLSGNTWGGVVKTGGRVDIGYDNGTTGVYADATFAWIDGKHVANNWMVDAGGGAYWRFYRTATGAMKVGVNLSAQSYNKNLDYYTYGQGGYFSPQVAVEATIPVEYTGRWGKLRYTLNGQVGIMNFHENSSPYFPLDPSLQALAEANSPTAYYPAQNVTTAIYGVSAKTEYEVAPLLLVGAQVSADNSYNYNEQSLMVFVRKKFEAN